MLNLEKIIMDLVETQIKAYLVESGYKSIREALGSFTTAEQNQKIEELKNDAIDVLLDYPKVDVASSFITCDIAEDKFTGQFLGDYLAEGYSGTNYQSTEGCKFLQHLMLLIGTRQLSKTNALWRVVKHILMKNKSSLINQYQGQGLVNGFQALNTSATQHQKDWFPHHFLKVMLVGFEVIDQYTITAPSQVIGDVHVTPTWNIYGNN